mmetsp:Transcript_34231/g.54817  ORF Transcript_34231/g.54817 Transcript_34231/m.54817 type:complete len:296 (+) Transcript_34231:4051-4938(+)
MNDERIAAKVKNVRFEQCTTFAFKRCSGTANAWKRERNGGSIGFPSYSGTGKPSATTRKSSLTLTNDASVNFEFVRKRPSSKCISRFSSRLFSTESIFRSAFLTPSKTNIRPSVAARTAGPSKNTALPERISRRCLRSLTVVSCEIDTYSTSRLVSSQYASTRNRLPFPGGPNRNTSCPSASFFIKNIRPCRNACDITPSRDIRSTYPRGTSSGLKDLPIPTTHSSPDPLHTILTASWLRCNDNLDSLPKCPFSLSNRLASMIYLELANDERNEQQNAWMSATDQGIFGHRALIL